MTRIFADANVLLVAVVRTQVPIVVLRRICERTASCYEPTMAIQNALASVAVKDIKAAKAWYEQLLARPAKQPMSEVAEWMFERGGGLQVYELPERAGQCSCTFAVDDLDGEVKRLRGLGLETGKQTSSARVKTLMITDPDGNHLAFAQAIDPTLAR